MIQLHKSSAALRKGSIKKLIADRQMIAYGRFNQTEKCVVVVNNSAAGRHVLIPVWEIGITDDETLTRVMLTTEDGYNVGRMTYPVSGGSLELEMPGTSSILLMNLAV